MRLDGKNAPQRLIANHGFSIRVEITARPEVPCIATVFLQLGEPCIPRLIATRFAAWTGVSILSAGYRACIKGQNGDRNERN